jgi:prepilin-type N-terminal cleavage/methylation domain-containing protein
MKSPRGYTLVEMLAAMTVGGVLLVIAAQVVTRAMQIDTTRRQQADISRSMTRLSRELRRDVHQARSVTITRDPLALKIELEEGGEVEYLIAPDEMIRSSRRDGEQPQREYYKKLTSQQVALTTLTSPERVELHITQEMPLVGEAPRTVLHTTAEVGRLPRLVGRVSTNE